MFFIFDLYRICIGHKLFYLDILISTLMFRIIRNFSNKIPKKQMKDKKTVIRLINIWTT